MITVRPAAQRGRSELDWLDSRHTFSFSDYYDPKQMGFGTLRVINDDRVAPAKGFGTHGHMDMEIISYVLDGALEHKDSIGTGSVIRPGDVQRMSAGTGVRHSEFNPSKTDPVRFLQIWIQPEKANLPPSYEQKTFTEADKRGRLRLVASRDGREGSVTVHQDVDLYATVLTPGDSVSLPLRPGRRAWVQAARGGAKVNGKPVTEGDGAAIEKEDRVELVATGPAELLVFDLA
jgi:redox-sensitive bicupin YhaK (pirin superfamily)